MTSSAGLRKIDISDNPMVQDSGAVELARALEDDDWVVELLMRGCGVSEEGHDAMVAMAAANTRLENVDLRDNPIDDPDSDDSSSADSSGGSLHSIVRIGAYNPDADETFVPRPESRFHRPSVLVGSDQSGGRKTSSRASNASSAVSKMRTPAKKRASVAKEHSKTGKSGKGKRASGADEKTPLKLLSLAEFEAAQAANKKGNLATSKANPPSRADVARKSKTSPKQRYSPPSRQTTKAWAQQYSTARGGAAFAAAAAAGGAEDGVVQPLPEQEAVGNALAPDETAIAVEEQPPSPVRTVAAAQKLVGKTAALLDEQDEDADADVLGDAATAASSADERDEASRATRQIAQRRDSIGFKELTLSEGIVQVVQVRIVRPTPEASFGFGLATAESGEKLVSKVSPGGLAVGKLAVADVIREVNGEPVKNILHADVVAMMSASSALQMKIERRVTAAVSAAASPPADGTAYEDAFEDDDGTESDDDSAAGGDAGGEHGAASAAVQSAADEAASGVDSLASSVASAASVTSGVSSVSVLSAASVQLVHSPENVANSEYEDMGANESSRIAAPFVGHSYSDGFESDTASEDSLEIGAHEPTTPTRTVAAAQKLALETAALLKDGHDDGDGDGTDDGASGNAEHNAETREDEQHVQRVQRVQHVQHVPDFAPVLAAVDTPLQFSPTQAVSAAQQPAAGSATRLDNPSSSSTAGSAAAAATFTVPPVAAAPNRVRMPSATPASNGPAVRERDVQVQAPGRMFDAHGAASSTAAASRRAACEDGVRNDAASTGFSTRSVGMKGRYSSEERGESSARTPTASRPAIDRGLSASLMMQELLHDEVLDRLRLEQQAAAYGARATTTKPSRQADEMTLASIEASFQNLHAYLDRLSTL